MGVHVNLTCSKPLFKENILATDGFLNNDFVKLLSKRKSKKVLYSLEKEVELQIFKINEKEVTVSHIYDHEYVHIKPSIN